jgi:hypothetical protein
LNNSRFVQAAYTNTPPPREPERFPPAAVFLPHFTRKVRKKVLNAINYPVKGRLMTVAVQS